jgi:tetratricopeptide (TPR) repeat protein
MNKETFNQLVKEPSLVDPKYKSELAQLVASFPYAANLKLLHLSALLNDTDVHFERELKKTTCYISDRRILKKIVQQPIDKSQYIIEEVESPLIIVKTDLQSEEIIEEIIIPQDEVLESDVPSEFETQPENEKITERIESKESSTEVEIRKATPVEVISELDQQIIASAVNASLSIEVDSIDLKDEVIEIKITEEEEEEEEEVPLESANEKKSFLDWIGGDNSLKKINKPDPKVQERIEFRKKAEDLINQFIVDQPRIDVKKEFFSPGNMAKKSIEDQNEIVSETLAKVYAAQGNNSKAIGTYEQLILKNPEKKSYFASLIKDLKSI